jgi:hypothetical protein
MALASTSRINLRYKPESTFGVIASAGNSFDLRVTGESLKFDLTKEMSKEINAARAVSSAVPVGASASGGIQGEMQYGEFDPLMIATLQNPITAYGTNGVGATFTATYTSTTITAAVAPTGSSAFTGLQAGQWFIIQAATGLNAGTVFRVSKSVAPTTTVITLDAGTPAQVESTIASTSVATSRLTNGTTQTSFSIERQSLDTAQYFAYLGQTPSKMSINIASGALSTISFDFMGKSAVRNTSSNLPGSVTASLAYDIHSGVTGLETQVWEGGAPLTGTYVKSLTLDYDNALRMQEAIGTLGAVSVASGQIVASMKASVYFANGAIFDKFLANTYTEFCFSSFDTSNNGYVFTAPRANISSYSITAGSKDQDLMADIDIMLLRDAGNATAGLRQVLFIDRCGAAVIP